MGREKQHRSRATPVGHRHGVSVREGRCRFAIALASASALIALPGCIGDARIELVAADAIDVVASELELSLREYHRDLELADNTRTDEVIQAFVDRIQDSTAGEIDANAHADRFRAALARMAADRATESGRFAASSENVAALRETARGLRGMGINAMSLEDETKRYFRDWLERRNAAEEPTTGEAPVVTALRQALRDAAMTNRTAFEAKPKARQQRSTGR